MTSTENYQTLREWLHNPRNKILWNEELLDVKPSTYGGLGVFARKSVKIEENQDSEDEEDEDDETGLLLRIPKSSILSPRNSRISNLLEEAELDGMIAIILAFLYEKKDGESSPWYGYLQSISYYEDKHKKRLRQPFGFWDKSILNYLKNTSAGLHIEENIKTVHTMYKRSIEFASKYKNILEPPEELRYAFDPTTYESESLYNPLFGAAFTAILGRVFDVDNYHGLSLVPGADLFNHKQEGDEDVHFISIGEVCEYCGKPSGCHHQESWDDMDIDEEGEFSDSDKEEEDEEEEEEEEEEEGGDDEEEEEEEITEITEDYIEKMEEQLKQEDDEENGENELSEEEDDDYPSEIEDEFGIIPLNELEYDNDECCDIKLSKSVKKGQEIFNTYGYLEPAECLVRYGFVVPSYQYTSVAHHFIDLTKGHEKLKPGECENSDGTPTAREFKKRLDFWILEGRLDFLEAVSDYAQVIILGNKVEEKLPLNVLGELYQEMDWKRRAILGPNTCSFETMVLASMATMNMEDWYSSDNKVFDVSMLADPYFKGRDKILSKILKAQRKNLDHSLSKLRSLSPKTDEKLQAQKLVEIELKSMAKDVSKLTFVPELPEFEYEYSSENPSDSDSMS